MKQGIKLVLLVVSLALFLGGAAGFAQQICDDGTVNLVTTKSLAGGGSHDRGSLTTLFASNNQFAGNMFDIKPAVDLEFTAIDINTSGIGVTCNVDVWYRMGTCVGFENSSTGWTLLASGTGTGAGTDNPTNVDLSGNGVTFSAGQVYGIYVDLVSYASGAQALRYTNGPATTYSNSELSLTSHCGKGNPAFTGSTFFDRIWNGTIYYTTGPQLDPRCDIKVNGLDSGAEIFVGGNCDITVSVLAGVTYAGQPVEIWWGSQKPQYLRLWYSGPLVDKKDTVWSGPLPVGVGSYAVGMGIDGNVNGMKDKLYFVDMADFKVLNPPTTYEYDDGSTENLLCWTLGGDMVWMHRFDTIPGGETIAEMHCIFGSAMYPNYAPGNGTACNVYVWDDPTNNGDPSDCVLLHTEPTVVANVDLDIYNIIPLTAPLPVVSGEFYIGCCMPHGPSQFCAPIDTTTTYVWGNGYYCGTNTVGGFDPKNLMNNQYTPAEWGNYWCIRAAY